MNDSSALHPYHPRHPLVGCQLKMVRANEHGKALNKTIDEFTERHPYAVVNDFKPEINYYVVRFKVREWPDPAWSPILGDIVHNMRSALDHLAWQLVIRNGRNPASVRSQFPIFTRSPFDPGVYGCPERAERARASWENQTSGIHSSDIELLKLLQPYQRGGEADSDPLAWLNQLSNWDKHKEFQFAAQSLMAYEFSVKESTRNALPRPVYFKPKGEILEDGEPIARFAPLATGADPKLDMNLKLFYDLAFGKGSPLEGLGIKQALSRIGFHVSGIIMEFKDRFDSRDFGLPS